MPRSTATVQAHKVKEKRRIDLKTTPLQVDGACFNTPVINLPGLD